MKRRRSKQTEYNEYCKIEYQNGIEEPLPFTEWVNEEDIEDEYI